MNLLPSQQRGGPVVWSGIIAATCVLLFLLQQMLFLAIPFLLGIVLYYILQPPAQRLIRMGFSQNGATLLVGAVFLLIVTLAVIAAVFWKTSPTTSWQDMLGIYLAGGLEFVRHTLVALEEQFPILHQVQLADTINQRMTEYTGDFLQSHLTDILVSVVEWLPSLLLAPFLTFFFLRDGLRFKKFLARAVPNAFFERTLCLLHEVDQTAHRYFQGLIRLTMLDTVVLAFGLWAIGVSSPLTLGLISAVLAWVPYVGSVVGCVLVVMVASTDAPADPSVAYLAIGVFIMVRLLDDFVFMPLTLGRSLHIHPLVTVLMIFIGGALSGVAGLMLVLPLLGVVMVIGETMGRLMTNPRLRARHRYARALRERQASADLSV